MRESRRQCFDMVSRNTAFSCSLASLLLLACGSSPGGEDGRDGGGSDGATASDSAVGDAEVDSPVDGRGGPDAGSPAPLEGPLPLLGRLTPTRAELEARSYDDLFVMDDSRGPLAALELPHRQTIQLDPEDPGSVQDVCIEWGIFTSGTMKLPSVQQTIDLLGADFVEGATPRACDHVSDSSDIYGCRARCRPSETNAQGVQSREDLQAHIDGLQEVRLLHPYMVAYPCDGEGNPNVRTERASIQITQFATTGDGFGWAAAFEESGVTGDNDVEGADTVWQRAWDLSARYGAYTVWAGDVSFPRRWYPAAPRTADNPLGIQCDTGEASAWFQANDFVGLQWLAQGKVAQALPDEPLPDAFLATYAAMPYMRAMSSTATFLTRLVERKHPGGITPNVFSTQGGSKGGMGCIYTVLGDPRVQHGTCVVFDAFDLTAPDSTASRFVSDWGICDYGGLRPAGGGRCVTGNFEGTPGPGVAELYQGEGAAIDSFRHTWELGVVLQDMRRSVPDSRIYFLTASTDFHWAAGSNNSMWTERPPPEGQYRMLLRMNADHGMTHLAPDDGAEGITFADWHHGAQEAMAYRAFFEERTPTQVTLREPPRADGRRVVARAQATSERGIVGARAWIAASTDRDFSLCTGIELGGNAVMCRGNFLCESSPAISRAECPGHRTAQCDGLRRLEPPVRRYLSDHLDELNLLPTRRPSGHFCWWRHLDDSGRDAAEQCVDPLGVLTDWRVGDVLPTERLYREGLGRYGDLPMRPPGVDGEAALPPIYRYRAYGEHQAETMLERWGFVNPYARDEDGEFVHWASGYFVPRPVTLTPDGRIELDWEIPTGADVDHFAVAIEAWDGVGADGLPDVAFTPIITVHPDGTRDVMMCE